MENSSMFWNKITEWLGSLGFLDISEFEAKLILLTTFLVLLFILWLVFRKMRLWYWKTDIQVETLKRIDERLHNVEEKLVPGVVKVIELMEESPSTRDREEPTPETVPEKSAPEFVGLTVVGRSGKIYTEAELEVQIRE